MLKSFQLAAILAATTVVTAQLTTNIGEESDANKFEEILFSSGGSRHRLPIHRRRNLLQTNDANADNTNIEANVDGDKQGKEHENEETASLLQERLLKRKKKDTKDKKKVGNNYSNNNKKENNKKQDMKDKGKGKFNNYQWKEKEEHTKNDWSWTGKAGKSGGGGGKNWDGGTDDHESDDKWWNTDDHPSKPDDWWVNNGKAGKKGKAEGSASDWWDWGGWDGNEWNDCICDDGELWRRGRELKNDEVLDKEDSTEDGDAEEVPRSAGAAAGKAITTKTESSLLIQQYWQPGGKASKSKSSKGKAKWCSCNHRKINGWPTVKPTAGPTQGPTPRPTSSSPTSSKPTPIPTKNPSGAPTSKAPTTKGPTNAPSTSEPTTKPPFAGPTDCVITKSVFNTIAPNAALPFSYAGFCLAVTDWNTRNPNNQIFMAGPNQKYELAAFFGNTLHESDGFTAPREYSSCRESITVNGEVYCKPEGYTGGTYFNRYCSPVHTTTSEPKGCDCLVEVPESQSQPGYVEANLLFFGRGAIHISWNYNYYYAGASMGVDLCTNPDFAASNADYVWTTAFWFWTMSTGAVGKTSAQSVAEGSFGGTVNIINGGLECPATDAITASSVISRLDDYCAASTALGADKLLDFKGCDGLQSRFDACLINNSCPSCSVWK